MKIEDLKRYLLFYQENAPKSQEAVYAAHGREFSNAPLTLSEQAELGALLKRVHPFKVGECYMNSAKLATERDGLKFCEGVAAGLWPVPHAWVSWRGRAIDVTWPISWKRPHFKASWNEAPIMRRVNHNLKTCVYFGIEVPTPMLLDHVLEVKQWSPLFAPEFYRMREKYLTRLTEWQESSYTTAQSGGVKR